MRLYQLIERNLATRKLSSTLTALSVALGVMLVSTILQLRHEMQKSYMKPGRGYALVVGAPGAPLQLVLSAVYHVEDSPGLMPMEAYDELALSPSVKLVVPLAVGDSFRGFPVVGTSGEFFSQVMPHPAGEKLAAGRAFQSSREDVELAIEGRGGKRFEAVVGATVATKLGLSVGDRIEPSHGVAGGGTVHEGGHTWEVVGIMRRSDTPVDRLVLINLDSFFSIREHQGGLVGGTGEQGLSAALLFPKPGMHKGILLSQLRKRNDLQVADVSTEIRRLFSIVGNVDRLLFLVASLVIVIGVISIMVAIYNTMNERRVELATLRAIGARKETIFALVVGEAASLAAAGGLLGILCGHVLVLILRVHLETAAGLTIDPWRVLPSELVLVASVLFTGALAGMLPAWKAYRTDVARNLSSIG